jgi:hypothetical protein
MNFLNPGMLFALGAAALPLLIHLFSRRRTKTVAWPTTKLLERMKPDHMRRLRLRQWLMVLLRTLIILLVALAAARPVVRGMFDATARTAAVIIVDGSASMSTVHEGETLFASALRRAGGILAMLDERDSAAVIVDAGSPVTAAGGMTIDTDTLARTIAGLEQSYATNAPEDAFAQAVSLLNVAGAPNREIYLLTDGAAATVPGSLPQSADMTRVYDIIVGPDRSSGPVVTGIEIVSGMAVSDSPVDIRSSVLPAADADNVTVDIALDGVRVGRETLAAASGVEAEAVFTVRPDLTGSYNVAVSTSDGRYAAGETRRTVLRALPPVRVTVAAERAEDAQYIIRALEDAPEQRVFRIRVVSPDQLDAALFDQTDVTVLSGIRTLDRERYASLVNAVSAGGMGLMVFPPADGGDLLYSQGIFRDLFPAEPSGRTDSGDNGVMVIDRFNLDHPVMRAAVGSASFQKPDVTAYLRLRPARDVSILANMSDGFPALGTAVCGSGEVMVFAVEATIAASDLPLTGVFVPLMIEAVRYLAGTETTGSAYEVGDMVTERVPLSLAGASVIMRPEKGMTLTVPVTAAGRSGLVTGIVAAQPGFYGLYDGEREIGRFCVNIPATEASNSPGDPPPGDTLRENWRWTRLDDTSGLMELLTRERYGSELTSVLLALALLLAAVEMALARKT